MLNFLCHIVWYYLYWYISCRRSNGLHDDAMETIPPPVPSTPILSIIRINTRIIENVQTRDHDCGKSSLSASQSLAVGSECSFVIVNYERTRWRYRPYSVPECAERRALLNLAVTHFMCRERYNLNYTCTVSFNEDLFFFLF